MKVGNAPVSYGAFELTVGIVANVAGPDELLAAIAAAGYAGTELGPLGYMGSGDELRARLDRHGLGLSGAWCQLPFSEAERLDAELDTLVRTLDVFDSAGETAARPVFADAGSDARLASPGRGKDDPSLHLDDAGWRRFADGVARAAELARGRGFEPVFHQHMSTYVEAPVEIERLLELTDVDLLVDTGHLLVGGADPIRALREWGPRVGYVHLKDARLAVVRDVVAEGAGGLEAWRRGIFCELGAGDVDLDGFLGALATSGYDGWLVVEQDRIPRDDEPLSEAVDAQVRNREWLRRRGL